MNTLNIYRRHPCYVHRLSEYNLLMVSFLNTTALNVFNKALLNGFLISEIIATVIDYAYCIYKVLRLDQGRGSHGANGAIAPPTYTLWRHCLSSAPPSFETKRDFL